ncbi:astacin-like metalloendopeptidase [Nerophis ophidion]|uniref:astacin-like metalloendopeptidase n=1 Tax=Nerophis ophidion TaxID=159077 RepID=UPI002ADF8FB7|nr:astacin-like metalloendopeptidase [Nerophis ophidion]
MSANMLLLAALLLLSSLHLGGSGPIHEAHPELLGLLHNAETLEELMTKDYGLQEGDIIIKKDRNAADRKWSSLQIPYEINPNLEARTDEILAAFKMVSKNTCLTFRKRTTEKDYIAFVSSRGCASYVGPIGGRQGVHVGPTCMVGNIVHEILHALGFYHEHTRQDRKDFITIVSENIMKGRERNFKMQVGKTFQLPYDLSSIMHYGSTFFSTNGRPTIKAKVKEKDMGQRVRMTSIDIQRVRSLYNCDSAENQKKTSEHEKKADEV